MAVGRMLGKNISLSDRIADLSSRDAKLFYTWSLAHTDDLRLLPHNPRTLKGMIIPLEEDITSKDVATYIAEYINKKLFLEVEYEGKKYYLVPDPQGINNLRRDRYPQTNLPIKKAGESPSETWDRAAKVLNTLIEEPDTENDGQSVTSDIPMTDSRHRSVKEEKRSEVKIREEKRSEVKLGVASPKIKQEKKAGMQSIGDTLSRFNIPGKSGKTSKAVSTSWQDKALRYAEKLKINLADLEDKSLRARYFKVFKDANDGKKRSNLERAYSYLADYTKPMTQDGKVKYFFYIYENGIQPKNTQAGNINIEWLFVGLVALIVSILASVIILLPARNQKELSPIPESFVYTEPLSPTPTATPTPTEKVVKPKNQSEDVVVEKICAVFTEDCESAVAIAKAESGLNCSSYSPTNDHGLFQINEVHIDKFQGKDWYDCDENIKVAHEIYLVQGWNPWVAYLNGSYKRFI